MRFEIDGEGTKKRHTLKVLVNNLINKTWYGEKPLT